MESFVILGMVFSKYLIHGALKTYIKKYIIIILRIFGSVQATLNMQVYVPQVWDLNTLQLTDVLSITKD